MQQQEKLAQMSTNISQIHLYLAQEGNNCVFRSMPFDPGRVSITIANLVAEFKNNLGGDVDALRSGFINLDSWKPPEPGIIKINTDASFADGKSSLAAIFRDSDAAVLVLACNAGEAFSALDVELQAIYLTMLIALGLVAIDACSLHLSPPDWRSHSIYFHVLSLVRHFDVLSFEFVPRNVNCSAHMLAKWSRSHLMTGFGNLGEATPEVVASLIST